MAGLLLLLVPVAYLVIQPIAPAHQAGLTEPPILRGATPSTPQRASTVPSNVVIATSSLSPTATPSAPPPSTTPLIGLSTSATDPSVAGYVIGGSVFRAANASWIVPVITCGSVQRRAVATWIGIGSSASGTRVRIGVTGVCLGGHAVEVFAWYQAAIVAAPVRLDVAVGGGDQVTAAITLDGGGYRFSLTDARSGGVGVAAGPLGRTPGDTASWLVDARPLGCGTECSGASLADFGRLTFSQAQAVGRTGPGTISEPLWSRTQVTMTTTAGQPRATTSGLSGGGSTFAVDWVRP